MTDRTEILFNLLNFSKKINEIQNELQSLTWDYDGPHVIFYRSHLLMILQRFLHKEVNEIELERWANLVEGREDINFENDYSSELSEIIYQLANPELEGKIDTKKCKEMIAALRS